MLEYLFVFLFGLSLGSFLNVFVYRIPLGKSLFYPPSSCPSCDNRLKWYHNIPLVSFVCLKGRCGFCDEKISFRYPIVELICGLLSCFVYFHYRGLEFFYVFFLFYFLLSLILNDIDSCEISNIGLFLFVIFALGLTKLGIIELVVIAIEIFIGATIINFLFGEVVGEGDYYILYVIAILSDTFFVLFLSSCFALVYSILFKQRKFPFVPFLALGFFLEFFFHVKTLLV